MHAETGHADQSGTAGELPAATSGMLYGGEADCKKLSSGNLCRPRQHRMLCRPDFTRCYDTGRRFFSRLFVVFVLKKSEPEATWRVGFAVTKKTGNAVTRNRVKRVLREFFRLHQGLIPPTVDVVVTPKRVLQPEHFGLDVAREELLPVLHQVAHWAGTKNQSAAGEKTSPSSQSNQEPVAVQPQDRRAKA